MCEQCRHSQQSSRPKSDAQQVSSSTLYYDTQLTLPSTWFIVPVPKKAVQTAVKQAFPLQRLSLLEVPVDDDSLFPNGFPAGMHPVVVNIGLAADIRMSALQLSSGLKQGSVYATYVSQNGKATPLAAALNIYVAGENGPLPGGLVPATASPLLFAGNIIRLGQFSPKGPPYTLDTEGIFSSQTKWALLPNPISGPGIYPEAIDLSFRMQDSAMQFIAKTFKSLINQPQIVPSGLCIRNQLYFTNATALTSFATGNVTLGPAASGYGIFKGALMSASPGRDGLYTNMEGFGGCAQNVGFPPETCEQAGKNLDLTALE